MKSPSLTTPPLVLFDCDRRSRIDAHVNPINPILEPSATATRLHTLSRVFRKRPRKVFRKFLSHLYHISIIFHLCNESRNIPILSTLAFFEGSGL